jgi:hypothetical protein
LVTVGGGLLKERVNMVEYYVVMYENWTVRPGETVLRMGKMGINRMVEVMPLRYIVSTFVNVTMYLHTTRIC